MKKIQILGTGCPRCAQLAANAEAAVRELGEAWEVEKLSDLDEIARLGLVATPALVVNGRIEVAGEVASVEKIRELLS
jgi:small redox-active disulfide protein 2